METEHDVKPRAVNHLDLGTAPLPTEPSGPEEHLEFMHDRVVHRRWSTVGRIDEVLEASGRFVRDTAIRRASVLPTRGSAGEVCGFRKRHFSHRGSRLTRRVSGSCDGTVDCRFLGMRCSDPRTVVCLFLLLLSLVACCKRPETVKGCDQLRLFPLS